MAWGVFAFSRDGRARLAGVLRALLIAQLVVSLCMVIFCYNTSLRVMLLLKHIHKVTVLLLYGLILFQAYGMKLHYTGGLRLIAVLLKCPHWKRATLVSSVWMLSGSLVAANGMLVYAACRGTLKALMKELSSSLRIGISQYLTEPTWKALLDTMQVELSCCGADKPTDWHDIPWINMDFLNEGSELVMKLAGADGKVLPPVSPYSCCTPRVLAPCYHDPLQQWREVWSESSPLLSASLHTRGCVEAVRAPLTRALLALQCFNMLVFLFQILIVVLTQLLRTSARAAVLRGDCSGVGPAVLLGSLPVQMSGPVRSLCYLVCKYPSLARRNSVSKKLHD
ncbi:RDS/peripherin-like protein xRDS35 [Helicoverpa zea]|uniref:RDS/peripherin-like protein xRDS35 n=1 Tax=Helicoverpa zea TaxID=7113 RepID=UPI001F589796|nr:RDS/peripherin-like protein xRDS35 [Helicoverpa zea]